MGTGRELIPRSVLFGNPEKIGAKLSPSGDHIAFIAPQNDVLNVWVQPLNGDGEARPVTAVKERPINDFVWAQNNEQILYATDTTGDENFQVFSANISDEPSESAPLKLTPSFPGSETPVYAVIHDATNPNNPDDILVFANARDQAVFDLYQCNTRTGEAAMKWENDGAYTGVVVDRQWNVRFAIQPQIDGGVLFFHRKNDNEEWETFAKIDQEDTGSGFAELFKPIGFNEDGSRFWMLDCRGRDTNALYEIDMTADTISDNNKQIVFESKSSDLTLDNNLIHPSTFELQGIYTQRLRAALHVLDPDIQADFDNIAKLQDGEFYLVSRNNVNDKWVILFHRDDGPYEYWSWDRTNQQGRFLFSTHPELKNVTLAKMQCLEIPARDGISLPSYLTLPANHTEKDGRLPMVLIVHGGPWARDQWGYNENHQWLSNRGYAVLSVNFRGSTGFGKSFLNAGNGEWYGKMQDDLNDAVEWAVGQGIADPSKVAIMGGSYGGYATLAGLTRDPELFACGVDVVGPSDIGTFLGTIPEYWESMRSIFETRVCPYDDKAKLKAISPLTHADNIKRPLLIGHGANDVRVKVSESDQIAESLESKDIPVTYVVFPDEGHGFHRPENKTAFNAIVEKFLATHLGGEVEELGANEIQASTADIRNTGGLGL
jgi:dipeptidyl aminopeptidase/acylaminoacyl peptidase